VSCFKKTNMVTHIGQINFRFISCQGNTIIFCHINSEDKYTQICTVACITQTLIADEPLTTISEKDMLNTLDHDGFVQG